MKERLLELLAMESLLKSTKTGSGRRKTFRYTPPPNGNGRRKHMENVIRKKKRRLIKKARSIQRRY